jgi:hypothetical protein
MLQISLPVQMFPSFQDWHCLALPRREGYKQPGDDGDYVDSAELANEGLPEELFPKLDVEAAYKHVKSLFPVSSSLISSITHAFILTALYRIQTCVSKMMPAYTFANSACTRLRLRQNFITITNVT